MTIAGEIKAVIWLHTASCDEVPSVSCKEPSGFITKTSGTTQACRSVALQWHVWPRQLRVVGLTTVISFTCSRGEEAESA